MYSVLRFMLFINIIIQDTEGAVPTVKRSESDTSLSLPRVSKGKNIVRKRTREEEQEPATVKEVSRKSAKRTLPVPVVEVSPVASEESESESPSEGQSENSDENY